MYLRLLYFLNLWKPPNGYQMARVWRNWACDQPVSCPCGIGVFTRRSELPFRCLLSKVVFFILCTLYIEHCLLILSLFVSICEIWLPELTYGVYLILFLKSGATLCLPRIPSTTSSGPMTNARTGGDCSSSCSGDSGSYKRRFPSWSVMKSSLSKVIFLSGYIFSTSSPK